jgi:hypothetical protein
MGKAYFPYGFTYSHRAGERCAKSSSCTAIWLGKELAILSYWSLSATLRCAYYQRQTLLGLPRSA